MKKTLICPGCGDSTEVLGESTTCWHRCPARRSQPTWYEIAPEGESDASV